MSNERKNGSKSSRLRALAFAALPILILVVILYRIAAWREAALQAPPPSEPAIASQIEILPDGIPLVAADGTIGHELVAWLNGPENKDRFFEVGGKQYVGQSATLLPAAQQRLRSLVDLMNAYPNVSVTIVGFTSPSVNRRTDQVLTSERTRRIIAHLVQTGISPKRLSADARGGQQPLVPGTSDINERIGIIFHKEAG